eukprot:58718-Amphidinium_carterae.1
MLNSVTACITWRPPSGSAPSKRFVWMWKSVTKLIVLMPLSGRIPLKLFWEIAKTLTARRIP